MKTFTRADIIGRSVRSPGTNGRCRWYRNVIDVSDCGKFIKLAPSPGAGKSRWVAVAQCTVGRQKARHAFTIVNK